MRPSMIKCLSVINRYRFACAAWVQIGTLLVAAVGVGVAWFQLDMLNDQQRLMNEEQRWKNYSELNSRYATLYKELPEEVLIASPVDFLESKPEVKRAVRQYFDLYSEEYWLYQKELIPKEMGTERIRNGVKINLGEYPILISGYRYWEAKGAFQHPADFRAEVEKLIIEVCRQHPKLQPCQTPS